jgi:hypothetical protein
MITKLKVNTPDAQLVEARKSSRGVSVIDASCSQNDEEEV